MAGMLGFDVQYLKHRLKWWGDLPRNLFSSCKVPARDHPVSLCFVFHTEHLYDEAVHQMLIRFLEQFHRKTGTRAICCVMTPECPLVREEMRRREMSEAVFVERLREVSCLAVIGYHGHFYRGGRVAEPIHHGAPDDVSVRAQFRAEVAWLRSQGFAPNLYTGGWWYLSRAVVDGMVEHGFQVDFSIRKGYHDCFGGAFLSDDRVPGVGSPFVLPGTRDVLAIQSLFGPFDPPRWMLRRHLPPLLNRESTALLFAALHTHDFDLPVYGTAILANVDFFRENGQAFAWRDFESMRQEAWNHIRD